MKHHMSTNIVLDCAQTRRTGTRRSMELRRNERAKKLGWDEGWETLDCSPEQIGALLFSNAEE